jgi:hypothetical protein
MKLTAECHNFEEKLNKLVGEEPSFWFFTPKVYDGKPFNGKYGKAKFNLSNNSHNATQKLIRINGTFIKKSEAYLITYQVDLLKRTKIGMLITIILFFIVLNFELYNKEESFKISLNSFFLIFIVVSFILTEIFKILIKKKFEKKFELKIISK